ncbi:uncharacterized protein KQ657_001967 [Scheffersomyces spartinae]|uniref:Uncharacterized protein n=1 Tax=Scheffersomyces spartinae TaxID=45513 RepID=A0A9P7V6F7_9ASCO|nr:uncharacterized protein KQ657_001967 [Scheffersomyces spartinae]KAG7192249.1 hypothetical protein KQ657_001967 [Scheffersomyces spartinae]
MSKTIPLALLLRLAGLLRRTLLSKKFYSEVSTKILLKTSTMDANLYFICYLTLMVASALENKPEIKRFLLKLYYKLMLVVSLVIRRVSGVDISKSNGKCCLTTAPQHFDAPTEGSNLAKYLKRISSYIADIRIFNRLTDNITYIPWLLDEFAEFGNPLLAKSFSDRVIGVLQPINCIVLEGLENAGWVLDHNWVGTSDNPYWSFETYIWCCRVWGLYLALEIAQLIRNTPISKWNKAWQVQLFQQVIQLPLVLHWSLRDGCLTPFWVGFCGSGASWFKFKDLWLSLDI